MRIRISPLFALYFGTIALFSSWRRCLCAIFALILHEIAHYLASRVFGERIKSLTLAPFGGVMAYHESYAPKKGIAGCCIALAGPLCSYIMMRAGVYAGIHDLIETQWAREFAAANLFILLINSLPVLPLDGGRAMFSIGFYVFPVNKLSRALAFGGVAAGCCMLAAGLYGVACMQILNMSLLIGGAFLIAAALQNHQSLMDENRCAVLTERKNPTSAGRNTSICGLREESLLLEGYHYLCDHRCVLFYIERNNGEIIWIGERQMISWLLKKPDAACSELINGIHNQA